MHIVDYISIHQILKCLGLFLLYIITAGSILIILHFTCSIPKEIFRKMLHTVAFSSTIILVYAADNWIVASISSTFFAIIIYLILTFLENWHEYDNIFVQRKNGEIKKSLLLLFFTLSVLITVFWGFLNQFFVVVTSVLMWGSGDATAALIGKEFGKHNINMKFADPKKTWEGSFSMMIISINYIEYNYNISLVHVFISFFCYIYFCIFYRNGIS